MHAHTEAEGYIGEMNATIARLARRAHAMFVAEGCSSYVKTIYVGYELDGEMVAAMYGHADHVEVALALPEDAEGSLLVDASHLTWRTLPVAALVRSASDLDLLVGLVSISVERIRSQEHQVLRENDFFMRSRRERHGR